MGVAVALFLMITTFFVGIEFLFENLVVLNMGISIPIEILCFFLLSESRIGNPNLPSLLQICN
jgi:hypothetical protein